MPVSTFSSKPAKFANSLKRKIQAQATTLVTWLLQPTHHVMLHASADDGLHQITPCIVQPPSEPSAAASLVDAHSVCGLLDQGLALVLRLLSALVHTVGSLVGLK